MQICQKSSKCLKTLVSKHAPHCNALDVMLSRQIIELHADDAWPAFIVAWWVAASINVKCVAILYLKKIASLLLTGLSR